MSRALASLTELRGRHVVERTFLRWCLEWTGRYPGRLGFENGSLDSTADYAGNGSEVWDAQRHIKIAGLLNETEDGRTSQ